MAGSRRGDPKSVGRRLGLPDTNPAGGRPENYPLRGDLANITRDGKTHERWQHKPTQQGDARIWFYIEGKTVHLEQVHTNHPNETK